MNGARDERGDRGELSPDDAARLSQHVAGAAGAGLPLGPGLRALAEESPRRRFRNALRALADDVERGVPLDEAVAADAAAIPPHLRGIIRAGARSGDIGEVLGRFSAVAAVGAELKRSFWSALAYPTLAVVLAVALMAMVDGLIVSRFEAIFSDFGIQLPTMTRALLAVSHAVRVSWPLLIGLVLALLVAWLFVMVGLPRASRNALLARLPLIGPLWRYTASAQFCQLLAALLESRLPLPEALRLTGAGIEDATIDLACRTMAASVEQGASLAAAMEGRPPSPPPGPFAPLGTPMAGPGFDRPSPPTPRAWAESEQGRRAILRAIPPGLPRLLKWAEGRSATVEVLQMAAESFQARSRAEASFGGAVLAVLAMIGVLLGVFVVVVGLFLPLIRLVSMLSG